MRIHSHSSLGSFENCPTQYRYQYIGTPSVERVDTIEAFLGKRVHETLEKPSRGLGPHPALSQRERESGEGQRAWRARPRRDDRGAGEAGRWGRAAASGPPSRAYSTANATRASTSAGSFVTLSTIEPSKIAVPSLTLIRT
jgi:hypothetical protein